jgi:hypothetical protein
VFRSVRRLPFFKVFALAQLALLARRHLTQLQPHERRRLGALVRRGPGLQAHERAELRELVGRLQPRSFAFAAADAFSPWPLPRFLGGRRRRF